MRQKRILLVLGLLDLFGIWMTVAAWRLLTQQTALADTISGETVAASLRGGVYVAVGLSLLLIISTSSTILLFWWPRRPT